MASAAASAFAEGFAKTFVASLERKWQSEEREKEREYQRQMKLEDREYAESQRAQERELRRYELLNKNVLPKINERKTAAQEMGRIGNYLISRGLPEPVVAGMVEDPAKMKETYDYLSTNPDITPEKVQTFFKVSGVPEDEDFDFQTSLNNFFDLERFSDEAMTAALENDRSFIDFVTAVDAPPSTSGVVVEGKLPTLNSQSEAVQRQMAKTIDDALIVAYSEEVRNVGSTDMDPELAAIYREEDDGKLSTYGLALAAKRYGGTVFGVIADRNPNMIQGIFENPFISPMVKKQFEIAAQAGGAEPPVSAELPETPEVQKFGGLETDDQGRPIVNTPDEAAQLPPGTEFVTPDGQVRVRK